MDAGFTVPSKCKAQIPTEFLYTPEGWVNALSILAKRQYLTFDPKPEDTLRALTVISQGCASGTAAGPVCESITRTVLLSDEAGEMTVEAVSNRERPKSWHNGFGATAACSTLVSNFPMDGVAKLMSRNREFLIAVFDGARRTKIYKVKERYLKKLGL